MIPDELDSIYYEPLYEGTPTRWGTCSYCGHHGDLVYKTLCGICNVEIMFYKAFRKIDEHEHECMKRFVFGEKIKCHMGYQKMNLIK